MLLFFLGGLGGGGLGQGGGGDVNEKLKFL